jgi:hypothetical protein
MNTIMDFLKLWQFIPSREGKTMFCSNSELRRMIERGSVEIDNAKATLQSPFPFEDQSVIIHPSGKHRTTLQ